MSDDASTILGTALTAGATKVMMLGSGELGKEVVIELQRLGVEVIAVDRYANAPAMQVAHRSYVIDMLDGSALKQVIEQEGPDLVVPEIEAIATPTLVEMERHGLQRGGHGAAARSARAPHSRRGAPERAGVPRAHRGPSQALA